MILNRLKAIKNSITRARRSPKLLIRRGVSQKALDSAERMMKEYQSDLDYLENVRSSQDGQIHTIKLNKQQG